MGGAASAADCTSKLAPLPAETDAASVRTSSTLLYPPSKWTYAQTYTAIDPSGIQLAEPSMPTDASQYFLPVAQFPWIEPNSEQCSAPRRGTKGTRKRNERKWKRLRQLLDDRLESMVEKVSQQNLAGHQREKLLQVAKDWSYLNKQTRTSKELEETIQFIDEEMAKFKANFSSRSK